MLSRIFVHIYSITNPSERRLLHINFVSYKILEKHKPTVPDDLITGTSDVIKSIFFCQSVCIALFYKCAKFKVISICCSEIKGCGHFVPPPPPPRAYKGPKSPGLIGLTDQEVNYLYDTGYFGIENPTSLQRTVWWIITKHFGQRARNEARQLKFDDIKLETEFESGSEYLVGDIERCTKTRTGEWPMGHKRAFKPKAFENKTDRCPVKNYKIFVSHRPPTMLLDQSPFFLGVRYRLDFKSDVWYLNKPLGKNSIGDFLSKASKILPQSSCSSRKVSNHSARKTCITNLLNENVNPLYVSQLSGHKKLESLQSYNQASMNIQKHMSDILGDTDSRNLRNSQSAVTQEQEIPISIQQQLLNKWNPVLPSTFHGALISNCTFNINVCNNNKSPPSKRRRVIIEDDSQ